MYMPNAKTQRQGPNATYIPLKMGLALATQREWNLHTNEMYMADARNLRHLTPEIPTCWYFLRKVTQKYYLLRKVTQKYYLLR